MALRITDSNGPNIGVLNRWADGIEAKQAATDKKLAQTHQAVTQVQATVGDASISNDPSSVSVSQTGYLIDNVLFSEITATYTAPNPLGTFAGIFLVVKNYRGSSELVKLSEHTFNGAAGGTATFKTTLQRTNETVTFYFVAKNSNEASRPDWANAPSASATLDGNAAAIARSTGTGKNLLGNPSFEYNDVATPLGSGRAVDQTVGNEWMVRAVQGPWSVLLEQPGSSFVHSGTNDLLLSAIANFSVPAGTTFAAIVQSPLIPTRVGDTLYFEAFERWDANIGLPAGLNFIERIGLLVFASDGVTLLAETVVDATNTTGVATKRTGTYLVPTSVGGGIPAFVRFEAAAFVVNPTGGAIATPNGLCADHRFDDLWLSVQENLDNVKDTSTFAKVTTTPATGLNTGTAVDASGNLLLKNIFGGSGTTSSPATTSLSYVNIPEMTKTSTTKGNSVLVVFSGAVTPNNGCQGSVAIFRDGSQISPDFTIEQLNAGATVALAFASSLCFIDTPSAASHTYEVKWKVSGAGQSLTALGTGRTLQVVELG